MEYWQKKLLKKFLEQFSEILSNNSCNDIPKEMLEIIPKSGMKDFIDWLGPDCDEEDLSEDKIYIPDWILVDYLRDQL